MPSRRVSRIFLLTALFVMAALALPHQAVAADWCSGRVCQEWVARYDGPGQAPQGNRDDYAVALAVDSSGNVYVTGCSFGSSYDYDYATIKYGPNGAEQWVRRYDGPASEWDYAQALVLDSSDNVYVTGYSWGTDTSADYATIKYDSYGNQVWLARYDGPASSADDAHALAVDASGNVYVTGRSWTAATGGDYATVKYDTDGNEQWVAHYDGPISGDDRASAVAVDPSGNVYVTGRSDDSGTQTDYAYATAKYDTDGNEQWVARYNGPGQAPEGSIDDDAVAVAVDGSGNVYVTGVSYGSGTGPDYATIKYDTDGDEQWVRRYDGPRSAQDWAVALAVDAVGNAYVTGPSAGAGAAPPWDYATIKYGPDGDELWLARYDGPGTNGSWDFAFALAMDASGSVYVTGFSERVESGWGYATVKYGPGGAEVWVARYDVSPESQAQAIAVDALGNAYVTGYSYGSESTGYDYATIKYSPPPPVGGLAQPQLLERDATADAPASSALGTIALAAAVTAAALFLATGTWYLRRRRRA